MKTKASNYHQRQVLHVAFQACRVVARNVDDKGLLRAEDAHRNPIGPDVNFKAGTVPGDLDIRAAWCLAYMEQHRAEPELMAKAEREVEAQQARMLLDFALESVSE